MATVIDNEQRVGGFVLFDKLSNPHHQFKMGVFRRNGKDVGTKEVVLA
jgi:hypothetical protein